MHGETFHSRLYAIHVLLISFFLFLSGCQATLSKFMPPLEEEGEVYLYTQPFPQEADRLRFAIASILAVSSEGRTFPLNLSLSEIRVSDTRRQRLLASGRLPPGAYVAFLLKVRKATLRTENGDADLLVPDLPARIDFPMSISRKRATVLSLVFKHKESIPDRIAFNPVFSVFIPSKPILSLTGYVTNTGSNNITVFDKKLGQVTGVIVTGSRPAGMALDRRSRRVYVALTGEDEIDVIDVPSGEIVDKIKLSGGDRPLELTLTPEGRTLLVVNTGSNTVSFIDPFSLLELGRVRVGNGPTSLLVDSTGRKGYVFNTLSSTVSVLDIPNRVVVGTIATDPGPLRGDFNRRGDRLYIIHELSSYLMVVNPPVFSTPKRFQVRMGVDAIRVDKRTDLVYLGRKNDTSVEVCDPLSFAVVDAVQTGLGTVANMAIDEEENNLYLVNPATKTVRVSNLISRKTIFEIDVGEEPYWVSVMGEK
jgi:YVTN family beta-propeller protein